MRFDRRVGSAAARNRRPAGDVETDMDEHRPFRGSWARSEHGWTWGELRGPRVQPLFRDVYIAATAEIDPVVRARAALLVHPEGVIGGVAAAAVWGSAYRPVEADVDVYLGAAGGRAQRGLRPHRDRLRVDEVATVDGLRVTTPARTALDLARRLPLVEAVAAVDALGRVTPLRPDEVRAAATHHPGTRDVRGVARVLDLVDPRATTPAWSRARVALVLRGIEVPAVSMWLTGDDGAPTTRLGLAWPDLRYGVAEELAGPPTAPRDPSGWTVARVDPSAAAERPDHFATGVVRGLYAAWRRSGARAGPRPPRVISR